MDNDNDKSGCIIALLLIILVGTFTSCSMVHKVCKALPACAVEVK